MIMAMAGIGQPSLYDPEIAEIILRRLAEGEGLNKICQTEGMPKRTTVIAWASPDNPAYPAFGDRYARARRDGLDAIGEGITDISDDLTEDPNSRRVRIDARKWLLSKMRPDKYGDRTTLEHTGAGGGKLEVSFVHSVAAPATAAPMIEAAPAEARKHTNGHVFLPPPDES